MASDNICPSLPGSFYRTKCILLLFIFVANGKVSSLHRGWMFFHGACIMFSFKALLPCFLFLVMPIIRWDAQECRHLSQTDSVFLYTSLSGVVLSCDSCLRNFCTYPTKAIICIKTIVCQVLHMPTPSLVLSFVFLVTAVLIDIR